MKSQPSLVLGSTSTYRRELLARLRIPFQWAAPGVDEAAAPGERGEALAVRLARAKAEAVAQSHPSAWVIGSDQVAILTDSLPTAVPNTQISETLFGKPGTVDRCIEQLEACSGRTLVFVTAVAVLQQRTAVLREFVDVTRVAFRQLERAAIERYIEADTPFDCAGGLKSEALGIALCESIDSRDPTALIGLPLIALSAVLRSVGFDLP